MTERLSEQEYRESIRGLIKDTIVDGTFELLPPRNRIILTRRFLEGEKATSYKRIGQMLVPTISQDRVRQLERVSLRRLHIIDTGRSLFPVDTLDLRPQARNALVNSGFGSLSLDALAQLSDDDLLWLRNFGPESLRQLREKLEKI